MRCTSNMNYSYKMIKVCELQSKKKKIKKKTDGKLRAQNSNCDGKRKLEIILNKKQTEFKIMRACDWPD